MRIKYKSATVIAAFKEMIASEGVMVPGDDMVGEIRSGDLLLSICCRVAVELLSSCCRVAE